MTDLQQFPAKMCHTSAAFLIHENKILLVKHKKLGIWLAPGGHIEQSELPHRASERECLEETGIQVRACDRLFSSSHCAFDSKQGEYLPSPFVTYLHWVCEANYQARIASPETYKPIAPWLKGCEQHLGFSYLVEPVDAVAETQNLEETDAIGWFTKDECKTLETYPDIVFEIGQAFELYAQK